MDVLRHLLRYLHLIGFALLFGGWVAQYATGRLKSNVTMRIGLGAMLVTGLLLAIPFPSGIDLNYVKLAVKLIIAAMIGAALGIVIVRERAGKPITPGYFLPIGGLTLANAAVAVFWR